MPQANCPTMFNILKSEDCLENLAGISADVYVGVKSDLAAPMTASECVYTTPSFAAGGLFKIQGKNEAQKISFSSLAPARATTSESPSSSSRLTRRSPRLDAH